MKTPACAADRGRGGGEDAGLSGGERALHVRMDLAEELVGAGGQGRNVVRDLRGGHDLTLELDGTRRVLDGDVVGRGFLVVQGDLECLVRGRRDRCRRELEVLGDHDDRIARRGGGGRRGGGRRGGGRAGGRGTGSVRTGGGD